MYFKDKLHQLFFEEKLYKICNIDTYIKSLIYLLSSNKDTRKNFDEIYDIKNNQINVEALSKPWQTSTSINICRLAFNLFGDITSDTVDDSTSYLYTVTSICKNLDINIAKVAIIAPSMNPLFLIKPLLYTIIF